MTSLFMYKCLAYESLQLVQDSDYMTVDADFRCNTTCSFPMLEIKIFEFIVIIASFLNTQPYESVYCYKGHQGE